MGIPEMIHSLVAGIPEADNGFALYFSETLSPAIRSSSTGSERCAAGTGIGLTDETRKGGFVLPYSNISKEHRPAFSPRQNPASTKR
jgi:hypothetical protein